MPLERYTELETALGGLSSWPSVAGVRGIVLFQGVGTHEEILNSAWRGRFAGPGFGHGMVDQRCECGLATPVLLSGIVREWLQFVWR